MAQTEQGTLPTGTGTRFAEPPPRMTADIYETAGGEAYVIEIPVPGLERGEIVIEATSDTLTVSTDPRETEPDDGRRYLRREQPVGRTSRVFQFPVDIDTDSVQATLERGLLTIRVPKAAGARRRAIEMPVGPGGSASPSQSESRSSSEGASRAAKADRS